MTVQMKIPTETKAIDRYLLAEYLQKKKFNVVTNRRSLQEMCHLQVVEMSDEAHRPFLQDDYSQDHVSDQ